VGTPGRLRPAWENNIKKDLKEIGLERVALMRFRIGTRGWMLSPQRCLRLVVAVGLVRLCDPESNAGGSLTTSRATHAGNVKG
jgi:hypothetical protein